MFWNCFGRYPLGYLEYELQCTLEKTIISLISLSFRVKMKEIMKIMELCPDISKVTVERTLTDLVKGGYISLQIWTHTDWKSYRIRNMEGGRMFAVYAKAIGEEIKKVLIKNGCNVDVFSDCYYPWGIDEIELDRLKSRESNIPFVMIDLDYYYLTNYEVTKYYTQMEDGEIRFWEYDYKTNFPVSCRPRVLVYGENKEILESIVWILCDEYQKGNCLYINHPILPNNYISFKIEKKKSMRMDDIKTVGDNLFAITLFFEPVNVPWFINKIDRKELDDDVKMQGIILDIIVALFHIHENCKKYMDSISQDDSQLMEHTKEKALSINSNRIELLNLADIPNKIWTISYIEQVREYVNKKQIPIKDAVNKIKEEEAIRKQIEEDKKKREERKQHQQTVAEQCGESDEYYDEYYDDYYDGGGGYYEPRSSSGISRIIEGTVSSYIANQSVVKAINRQTRMFEERDRERARREDEVRRRSAEESREKRRAVIKMNQERNRKGLPELPIPPADWY